MLYAIVTGISILVVIWVVWMRHSIRRINEETRRLWIEAAGYNAQAAAWARVRAQHQQRRR